VLHEYAAQLLALEQQATQAVRSVGEHSGELRIGSMETFAAVRLPAALKRVRAQHAGLGLKVETNPTQQLIERVLAHKLDCAFVGGPVDHLELVAETVVIEELVLILGQGQEGDALPLILFREGCAYRARALSWQRECGHPNAEVMELGTLDGILGCVAVGLGYTLMPRWVVSNSAYAEQLAIRELPRRFARIPTVMIRQRATRPLSAMLTLRDAVVDGDPQALVRPVA